MIEYFNKKYNAHICVMQFFLNNFKVETEIDIYIFHFSSWLIIIYRKYLRTLLSKSWLQTTSSVAKDCLHWKQVSKTDIPRWISSRIKTLIWEIFESIIKTINSGPIIKLYQIDVAHYKSLCIEKWFIYDWSVYYQLVVINYMHYYNDGKSEPYSREY